MSGCLEKVISRTAKKARKRTSARVFERIMVQGADGQLHLREVPPVLEHVDAELETTLIGSVHDYLTSVPADVALLLSHFRITDMARRVVGVGSVGTRCYLVVLTGPAGEPLILQIKEAGTSMLEQYGKLAQPDSLREAIKAGGQGARVVDGQRVLQAMSDVFLGTARADGRDFYIRQFQDMKGTIETEGMSVTAFGDYVSACALVLARGHAQSANASILRGYVGNGEKVSAAVIEWSYAYAEKSLADFHQVHAAAKAGDIEVAADPAR